MSVGFNRAEASRLIAVLRHINDGQGDAACMDGEGWHRASFADVADQLEAAGMEVERLDMVAASSDAGARWHAADNKRLTAERDSLRHQLAAVRVAIDGNRPLLATSEAAQRLVDDIIRESTPGLADIRSQRDELETERVRRDAELAEVGSGRFDAEVLAESRRIEASSLRTERDSLRQQLDKLSAEYADLSPVGDTNEILSLRQQLEAAQRSDGMLSASLESTMTELTAAQQRIAELEIELAEEYNEHERLRSIQLHTAARLVRTSQARRDHAESTIRTIWPVYRAAVDCETSDRENENGEYISHERAELNLSRALDVARAALTPDVLAALKAMGLEIE